MRTPLLVFPLLASVASPLAAAEVVPVPEFRSIELSGGGAVIVRPGPAQVTLVDGSTEFTRFHVDSDGKLKIEACNDRCPRHYTLTIEVRYPTVPPMGVNGGGQITVETGFGPQEKIALGADGGGRIEVRSLTVESVAVGVNGGGQIDLRAVTADSVAAGVNGGGKVFVGPSKTLAAGVNGGGEVRYAGNPQVTTAIDGGGSVKPDY